MSLPSSSRASDFSVRGKRSEGEKAKDLMQNLIQLKKRVQASRSSSIKEKLMKNGKTLEVYTCHLYMLATSKSDLSTMEESRNKNVLTLRVGSTLCNFDGSYSGILEKDIVNNQEELLSSGIVFGHSSKGKSLIRLIKLPFIEKMPPYTTWIFVDRNQRMAEDQSVVGRRQIYYDPCGSETLICSDSEEDIAEPEEEKHEFSEGEDHILWKALQEHGITQEVLKALCQFIDANTDEIQERYEILLRKHKGVTKNTAFPHLVEFERKNFFDRTLSMALDSFDNLFCRRCLIFDCRLHGCSQTLVTPNEKLPFFFEPTETMRPCSEQCYLRKKDVTESKTSLMLETESASLAKAFVPRPSEEEEFNSISEQIALSIPKRNYNDSDKAPEAAENSELLSKGLGKRKVLKNENADVGASITCAEKLPSSFEKKQKRLSASDPALVVSEGTGDRNLTDNKDLHEDLDAPHEYQIQHCSSAELLGSDSKTEKAFRNIEQDDNCNSIMENEANNVHAAPSVNSCESNREKNSQDWNPFEKDLYLKGVEIFGRNSCLIARNMLPGLKTCCEVSSYMYSNCATVMNRPMSSNPCVDDSVSDPDYMEQDMSTRTRIWRRRGKARKLKYTWKSTGHPSIRKHTADGKHQSCKQYTPCGCQQICGKQCPCLDNGTCCEKYCGCSKSCKNRFRGCHCAKSQCRSRQCPCFAAGRECDPDVCRNCWVSCGDGSLGDPPGRNDGYQCGNMNLLLKQKQKIILAKSDVAGWGAFIKNPVNKNDYLGEYTGELISHKEADKRGKIYDRANSSFLFDLNDQYVLDAYRKGDKLKFANHSSNPNCYAKVMLVAGDHRVGIFAKEHIEAGEELFYDYRYGPDQAPAWARKPESSKRDDSAIPHGRAQKIA